jgi:hypothetical protein
MNIIRSFVVAAAAFFIVFGSAQSQNIGAVPNHAVPVGKGPGQSLGSVGPCNNGIAIVGQGASTDPHCGSVDLTAGVTGSLPVANGGTGAATATNARTNLGLVIGTNVEAWDADLDCVAALASTGLIKRTGSGTCSAGTAALSDLATGTQDTVVGYWGSTTASALAINNCSNALTYSTATHTFGCNASAGTGTVTSISAGGNVVTDTGSAITSSGTLYGQQLIPGGRLTVTSATPVMQSAANNQTTIYYAPFAHGWVPIYNGTVMRNYSFTSSATDAVGLSVALGSNWTANTNYDWFVGLNSSVVTLCSGPAWSSGTSRGAGAGTTELQLYNGLYTNKNSMTCRSGNATTFTCAVNQCTYVGTTLTDASNAGQISWTPGSAAAGGGAARLSIWNAANRMPVRAQVSDSTASWTYSSGTPRAANNSAGNRVAFVTGAATDAIIVHETCYITSPSASGSYLGCGTALDATNTLDHSSFFNNNIAVGTYLFKQQTPAMYPPQLGSHFVQMMEQGDTAHTFTINGGTDLFGAPATFIELSLPM